MYQNKFTRNFINQNISLKKYCKCIVITVHRNEKIPLLDNKLNIPIAYRKYNGINKIIDNINEAIDK